MNVDKYKNPFPNDPDRHAIWEMLVERDIIAFCKQDWSIVADDFIADEFMGVDGGGKSNVDSWRLSFPDLEDYKKEWLAQAEDAANTAWAEDFEEAMYKATNLRDIDIVKNVAVAHKKFDGLVKKKDGTTQILHWQTLYRCKKVGGKWKLQGFLGYLPYSFSNNPQQPNVPAIQAPTLAAQHATAGPYSPVLEVESSKLVVISGQAAIDKEGSVIGDTIEEQTRLTMENCAKQLKEAGCTFNDVFKVNVYLTDLANWPRFNEVYRGYFDDPLPVRTAVQTPLLMTILVEIDMWAAKS